MLPSSIASCCATSAPPESGIRRIVRCRRATFEGASPTHQAVRAQDRDKVGRGALCVSQEPRKGKYLVLKVIEP